MRIAAMPTPQSATEARASHQELVCLPKVLNDYGGRCGRQPEYGGLRAMPLCMIVLWLMCPLVSIIDKARGLE